MSSPFRLQTSKHQRSRLDSFRSPFKNCFPYFRRFPRLLAQTMGDEVPLDIIHDQLIELPFEPLSWHPTGFSLCTHIFCRYFQCPCAWEVSPAFSLDIPKI